MRNDPVSRRAAIAAKARNRPKEQFNNLLHHLTYELVKECLNRIPSSGAVGVDEMTVDQARENLTWLLPPILKQIHNGCYEQDFLKCSFGFRPGLSCHHALASVNELLYRFEREHVLEVDIQDFFGSLNHEWLKKFLGLRIGDRRVLKLIEAWLTAGVMEEGKMQQNTRSGAPQGG